MSGPTVAGTEGAKGFFFCFVFQSSMSAVFHQSWDASPTNAKLPKLVLYVERVCSRFAPNLTDRRRPEEDLGAGWCITAS